MLTYFLLRTHTCEWVCATVRECIHEWNVYGDTLVIIIIIYQNQTNGHHVIIIMTCAHNIRVTFAWTCACTRAYVHGHAHNVTAI